MTNPIKGEVGFDWRGQSWRMVLNTNAKCELEGAYGRGFIGIALDAFGVLPDDEKPDPADPAAVAAAEETVLKNLKIGHTRAFMFHGLRQFHPDVTINDVGFMIDDLGTGEAMALVEQMFAHSQPEADAGAEGNGSAGSKPSSSATGSATSPSGSRKASTKRGSGKSPPAST